MVEKQNILQGVLNQYFIIKQEDLPTWADFALYRKEDQQLLCFAIYKENKPDKDTFNKLQDGIYSEVAREICINVPIVCFVQSGQYDYEFGILLYWDYNRCYENKDINWRTIAPISMEWLCMQCSACRMRISPVQERYQRVIKTIELNSSHFIEAEIIYMRQLSETYKMKPHKEYTAEERFNRILRGTPQNEYPNDELDEYILENIRDNYPSADIKSKLLLFDVDLLNLRQKKDKKYHPEIWTIFRGGYYPKREITLEVYYYPNWKNISSKPVIKNYNNIVLNFDKLDNLITNTYYPLSEINI